MERTRGREDERTRGRGGKEKEGTDCVPSVIRAFGRAGDWKATTLEAEVSLDGHGRWAEVHGRVEEIRGRRG